MSLAVLKLMLCRTLRRTPTDAEIADCVMALQEYGGERLYIPQRQPCHTEVAAIVALRDSGLSIRKIARSVGRSKSQVHRALSQNPALKVDS